MFETNSINDVDPTREIRNADRVRHVDLSDPALVRIERLRLISDPGFPAWDLSYCWGVMEDGEHVWVCMPFFQLRKGRSLKVQLVDHFQKVGRHAKRMGAFDALSTCN